MAEVPESVRTLPVTRQFSRKLFFCKAVASSPDGLPPSNCTAQFASFVTVKPWMMTL